MNEKLKALYEKNWHPLLDAIDNIGIKAANPLLIKVNDDYVQADVKVMVVGQETDGWLGELNKREKDIDDLMNSYNNYFYGGVNGNKKSKDRKTRPFWNRKNFKYFEDSLKAYFNKENLSTSFIWNNISKIGNIGRGKPINKIRNLERKYFNILKEEIEILNPSIVIFTTGETRDEYIKHHFGQDVKFIPKLCLCKNSQTSPVLTANLANLIAEIKLPNTNAKCAIRIEHPNRRNLHNAIALDIIKDIWEKN